MTEAERLSDALQGLFSNPEHGWFTPISVAIAGLTAAQAATVPAPRFNSVWAVVNHVRFWHELTLLRLRGISANAKELWADNGWPPAGDPTDERAWERDCQRLLGANKELAAEVAKLSDEQLGEPIAPGRARRYQVIQGLIAHNSYHTNEVISIRHMLGLWLERT